MAIVPAQRFPRPLGMRIIIGYKLVKSLLVLGLAVWLTLSSGDAYREARHFIGILNEHPGLLHKLALWLDGHVTLSAVHAARIVAWLDCATTALEAGLLITGKVWGEWLVVAGVAALLPFEVQAVIHHPHPLRISVLFVNLLMVVYLAWRRLHHQRVGGGPGRLNEAAAAIPESASRRRLPVSLRLKI